jgi:undecaprenyl phosphate-alpha-L-ara4N flippase subunit ArnE
MLLWLKILKKLPLSKAYPLNSLSYLIIPLISETLFPEKLSLHNYAGVLLIVTGLILTGQEKKS